MKFFFCNDVSEMDAGDYMIHLKSYEEESEYSWLNSVEINEMQYVRLKGRF